MTSIARRAVGFLLALMIAAAAGPALAAWVIVETGDAPYNVDTLEQARAMAIEGCARKKITCRFLAEGRSGCAAFVQVGKYSTGPGYAGTGRSEAAAGASALKQCQAKHKKGCELAYAFCDVVGSGAFRPNLPVPQPPSCEEVLAVAERSPFDMTQAGFLYYDGSACTKIDYLKAFDFWHRAGNKGALRTMLKDLQYNADFGNHRAIAALKKLAH